MSSQEKTEDLKKVYLKLFKQHQQQQEDLNSIEFNKNINAELDLREDLSFFEYP